MRYPLFALVALLVLGSAAAFTVKPAFQGVHDTGNQNYPLLDVGITVDCDSKNVTVTVASNETGEPLGNAMAYLFYTDYEYQALPNPGKTDAAGKAQIPVPGTIRFLNAMFILRVDRQGYQSREIEFTYKKCFEAPPKPPEPDTPVENDGAGTANQTANQTIPQNVTPPANTTPPSSGNGSEPIIPQNPDGAAGTGNVTPQPEGDGAGKEAPACPGAVLLCALAAIALTTKK